MSDINAQKALLTAAGTIWTSLMQLIGVIPDTVGKVGVVLGCILTGFMIINYRKANTKLDIEIEISRQQLQNLKEQAMHKRRKDDQAADHG